MFAVGCWACADRNGFAGKILDGRAELGNGGDLDPLLDDVQLHGVVAIIGGGVLVAFEGGGFDDGRPFLIERDKGFEDKAGFPTVEVEFRVFLILCN